MLHFSAVLPVLLTSLFTAYYLLLLKKDLPSRRFLQRDLLPKHLCFIFVPLVISICAGPVIQSLFVWGKIRDIEYLTGYALGVYYDEEWTERVTRIETDTEGHMRTRTSYQYHAPMWWLEDSLGKKYIITEARYLALRDRWKNEICYSNKHLSQSSLGDGRSFKSLWLKSKATAVMTQATQSYSNRVQRAASNNVYNFPEVTLEQARSEGVYDYPAVRDPFQVTTFLGGAPQNPQAVFEWNWLNASLGAPKQIKIWVLLFPKKSARVSVVQRAYWQGGNKNELVICIGTGPSGEVSWCDVWSWCDVAKVGSLHEDIEKHFLEYKETGIDWLAAAEFVRRKILSQWRRKEFSDFEYIQVELPVSAYVTSTIFGLTLGVIQLIIVLKGAKHEL